MTNMNLNESSPYDNAFFKHLNKKVYRGRSGNTYVTRKHKSGEAQHIEPKKHTTRNVSKEGGQLVKNYSRVKSIGLNPKTSSKILFYLQNKGPESGKGNKAARRIAQLRANKKSKTMTNESFYFDVYLPIANILIESTHAYRKSPGKVYRHGGAPFISRKPKSGERLHIQGSRGGRIIYGAEGFKVHKPNTGESGGQLARIAKGASSELKKHMVQTGSETDPYSLGKGSKSARRVAALKAKRRE